MNRRVAVVAALRTPVGRYGGALASIRPDDLAAHVIRAVVERSRIDPSLIDDVYLGAANQAGEDNRDVARMAVLLAGLPDSVPGCTVNRLCSSGLEAINIAARMIEGGGGDVMIAGGVESMTRAPFVFLKGESAWDRTPPTVFDTTIGWRFTNPALAAKHHPYSMGETAENVARKWGISREEQDRFAFNSQMKWKQAHDAGLFGDEIVPVEIPQRKGAGGAGVSGAGVPPAILFNTDEHPRPDTTMEALARLRPAFAKEGSGSGTSGGGGGGGTVTAGNASGINDGAAALLLVEADTARRLGLTPLAFVGPSATAGVDPACMGIGPVPATRKALARAAGAGVGGVGGSVGGAGLTIADIELFELNEAFAAQSIACIRDLGLDESRVNVNGGAIAIGHPLGCSGARIATTLIHEMKRRKAKHGVAALCVGVGQGVATVFHGVD
jgi:acetyl-CoA acetyltransferase family protein